MDPIQPYKVTAVNQLRYTMTEIWDNGIIYIRIKDHAEITLQDSREQYEFMRSRFDGVNKFLILVEPGSYTSLTKEAREFSTIPKHNEMTAATAVIVKSLAQKLVINFIISFTRQQTMKMRMFHNKQDALNWLLNFKNNKP